MVVIITCKNEDYLVKSVDKVLPISTLWEISVAMETSVLVLPKLKPKASPNHNDSDKI